MRIFNIIYRTADNTIAEANIAATNKSKATFCCGQGHHLYRHHC